MHTLEDYLRKAAALGEKRSTVIREIYERVLSGELRIVDPKPPSRFDQYMLRLDYSLWFWTVTALVALTYFTAWLSRTLPWLMPLRYVIGTVFLLFLPGYAILEVLYADRAELRPIEELGLSMGLSLATVPLIAFVLNLAGLQINFENIASVMSALILATSVVAAYRKYIRVVNKNK